MTASPSLPPDDELARLRAENATLREQVGKLADANAYAAELLAELEEAQERESMLRQRGEELALQASLDTILQQERDERRLLARVIDELERATAIGSGTRVELFDSPSGELGQTAAVPIAMPAYPGQNGAASLVIPLQAGGRVFAALRLDVTAADEAWWSRWVPVLWSLGRHTGAAITRLRAEHKIERMNAELIVARDEALEANRTKSTFLANMSHELRTPMNAIIGYSEMLIEDADTLQPADFVPDLQKIQTAGKHLLSLINDVLDLSKLEAGKMTLFLETFSVADVVRDVVATVQPLMAGNRNTITVVCPDDIGVMTADIMKVRQTLLNLLGNAAKFTEGGHVSLTVASEWVDGHEQLTFAVQDSGIGMSDEQVARLFRAFEQADGSTTRRFGGTGLGLTISRRFCQMMQGDIRVASTAGDGSTFTVVLPRTVSDATHPGDDADTEASDVTPATESAGVPLRGRILAIDDNREALDLIQRGLAREGFQVITASTGESGVALARTERPDVITLDVMMPRMNGWEVLALLKADPSLADIPVLLLSVVDNREAGLARGATECLTKPIDWARLETILGRLAPDGSGR